MAVENTAQKVQYGDGELAEYPLMCRPDDAGRFDEGVISQVVPVIPDDPLLRPPSHLEMPEAVIAGFRPAQAEAPVAVIPAPADCLPHDQITRPQVLKSPVRSAVFVEDLIGKREIDVGSDRSSPQRSQDDKPHIPKKDMILNTLEETSGLGGKSMGSPGQRVQTGKGLQGIRRGGEGYVKILFFGFPDVPPGGVGKRFCPCIPKIEGMGVMPFGGFGLVEEVFSPSQFQITPATLFTQGERGGEKLMELRDVSRDRFAIVGEGEGNSPFTGKSAIHLHDWEEAFHGSLLTDRKIEGFVIVGFPEDFGPVRRVEKGTARSPAEDLVPVFLSGRAVDLYLTHRIP